MATNNFQHFGIRDNHSRGNVADFLADKIGANSQLSVVSAYFTIYAYEALAKEVDEIGHLKFLFGEPRFIATLDPEKTDKKAFQIEDDGLELSNRLQQKEVARRCAKWIRNKVEIRSVRQANLLHGKRRELRQVLTHDGWAKMEVLEIFDSMQEMTDRVLNPASHSNEAPLYEEEVRRAKTLIDRLEQVLLDAKP